jgi:alpha-L-fucosidase
VGFYHSLIDWHHPDFTIDGVHPLRDHPQAAELNRGRDMQRYATYLHSQVHELLTQFAPVDILWMDFSYPEREYRNMPGKGRDDWRSQELYQMVRQIAPRIIINNRMDLADVPADLYTPEQYQPLHWHQVNGKPVVWEACHTFSGSWGYHRDETTWKSPEQLIHLLVNSVACGGNLLMNVGPTGRGNFDPRAVAALQVYSDWMRLHGRSIYGCTQSDFIPPDDVRYTQNGNRLYAHLFAWPFRNLQLPGLAGKVAYAQLLNDASQVLFKEPGDERMYDEEAITPGAIQLFLPVIKPAVTVPVVELFLKE